MGRPRPNCQNGAARHSIIEHPFTARFARVKARQLCRKPGLSRSEVPDLVQGMILHLWKSADQYDPARADVETFVTVVLNTWVTMFLRNLRRTKRGHQFRMVSLDSTMIRDSDGRAVPLRDTLSATGCRRRDQSGNSPNEIAMLRERIVHALADLDPDDRDFLRHVATHGIGSTARSRGKSRHQVSRRLSKLRRRIRK